MKKVLKIFLIFILAIILISINVNAILLPVKTIKVKINNVTRGCEVYVLLPKELIKYNIEKTISNNKNNPYEIQAKEAETYEKFLKNDDYLGYMEYSKEVGYEVEDNEIVLRHYCSSLGRAEVKDYIEYNGKNYVQIKIYLSEDNEFKISFMDYLYNYNPIDVIFMVDEFGSKTYFDLVGKTFNPVGDLGNQLECSAEFDLYSNEEYASIENATDLTYLIVIIVLIIIFIIILIMIYKYLKNKKEEKEARKFWIKKLTKEEKKEQKKQLKQLKKKNRMQKKKKY